MSINKNTAAVIAAALLLVGGGIYYFFRSVPEPPPAVVAEKPEDTIQYLGSALSETKDGKLIWELTADQIQAGVDKKNVMLQGLHAKIYKSDGQGNIQVTASQGQMDMTDRVVTLQGDIKAVSEKGAELVGNMIKWFMKEQRFVGEGGIHYQQKDVTISGDKLEVDQNLNVIRITGNARAEMRR